MKLQWCSHIPRSCGDSKCSLKGAVQWGRNAAIETDGRTMSLKGQAKVCPRPRRWPNLRSNRGFLLRKPLCNGNTSLRGYRSGGRGYFDMCEYLPTLNRQITMKKMKGPGKCQRILHTFMLLFIVLYLHDRYSQIPHFRKYIYYSNFHPRLWIFWRFLATVYSASDNPL